MTWLPVIFCIAGLCLAIYAYVALRTARRAIDFCVELDGAFTSTAGHLLEVETMLAEFREQTDSLSNRVDRFGLRQSRLETAAGKTEFKEAIAIARHGASTRELIDTCGVSPEEARLIQVLHGAPIQSDPKIEARQPPQTTAGEISGLELGT